MKAYGSIVAINAALKSASYRPDRLWKGMDTLNVSIASKSSLTGNSVELVCTTLDILVTYVNMDPKIIFTTSSISSTSSSISSHESSISSHESSSSADIIMYESEQRSICDRIVIRDLDSQSLSFQISVTAGLVGLGSSFDHSLSINATLDQINAYLPMLVYHAPAYTMVHHYDASILDVAMITVIDGSGGFSSAMINIYVLSNNNPPQVMLDTNIGHNYSNAKPFPLAFIQVSDREGDTLTLHISIIEINHSDDNSAGGDSGSLQLATAYGVRILDHSDTSFKISGSPSSINLFLSSSMYRPSPTYVGDIMITASVCDTTNPCVDQTADVQVYSSSQVVMIGSLLVLASPTTVEDSDELITAGSLFTIVGFSSNIIINMTMSISDGCFQLIGDEADYYAYLLPPTTPIVSGACMRDLHLQGTMTDYLDIILISIGIIPDMHFNGVIYVDAVIAFLDVAGGGISSSPSSSINVNSSLQSTTTTGSSHIVVLSVNDAPRVSIRTSSSAQSYDDDDDDDDADDDDKDGITSEGLNLENETYSFLIPL